MISRHLSFCGLPLLLLSLTLVTVTDGQDDVGCGLCEPHIPLFSENYFVSYNDLEMSEDTYVFPTEENLADYSYTYHFFGKLNFNDAPDGKLFVGARNVLYEMNKATLSATKSLSWSALDSDNTACMNDASDPEIACENYVRLYKRLPFENSDDRLLICGTGAFNVTCRTVDRMDIKDTSKHGPVTPGLKIGIISPHPYFPFDGDFLGDLKSYETTGYYAVDNPESFTFARYNVSYDVDSKEISFSTMSTRNGVDGIGFSINNPYYPVKLIKQNLDGTNAYKMSYYFIREKKYYDLSSDAAPVRARFIRVCQDDQGLSNTFYKTFVKMEILCFGEHLQVQQAVGTQEHYYTVLRDIVQAETPSRFYGDRKVWAEMVYMVFTTDVYGPNATAICVYHSHFTGTNNGYFDLKYRGIIDVFSFNEYRDEQGLLSGELNILNCDEANKRSVAEQDHIISSEFVTQFSGLKLPLMESAGEVLTKIVVDKVCVKVNINATCLFQDVLFVGNHKGRVKKMVMTVVEDSDQAELNGLTHDAIVTQEWQLADENGVEQLHIEDGNLYVGTYSRLYKFPVSDCSRHTSCYSCVGSRDPYCYWDLSQSKCLKTNSSMMNSSDNEPQSWMNPDHLQNIHTGEDSKCNVTPICSLTMNATASDTIMIDGLDNCNYTNSFEVTIEPYENCEAETITKSLTKSDSIISEDQILGRRLYNVVVKAIGDNGNASFSEQLLTPNGAPVAPTASEVIAGAINSSFIEVVVSLDGCNIHDELENHEICVQFNSVPEVCQEYNGVNAFVSGPYNGSESVNYTVKTKNNYGNALSTLSTVTTRVSLPEPPANVFVPADTVATDSVSLRWTENTAGSNDITGYSIYVNGVKRTDCSTQDTEYTLYGLYSFTEYNFSVASCNNGGESERVQADTVITNCQRPTPVRDLRVTNAGSVDITFAWDEPLYTNGSNIRYQVSKRCYNRSSLMMEDEMTTVMDTMYTLTDLSPLTRCCASVQAVSNCSNVDYRSESELSCSITEDGIPGPVDQLTVTPNPNALLVTWLPPSNYTNPSLRYNVSWKSDESDFTYTKMYLDQLYFYINDVNQSQTYTVTVEAISMRGVGPTALVIGMTLPDIPSAPHDVNISFSGCSMTVSWSHDDRDDYDVMMYRVRAHCNDQSYTREVVSTGGLDTTISNICEEGTVIAWCTAQVQALNTIGYGEYSLVADEVFPPFTPPTPMCFKSIDSVSMTVFISYTVTYPFSLDDLVAVYTVDPSDSVTIVPASGGSFNGTNMIVLSSLDRTLMYTFRLRLCTSANVCSDYCVISDISPPQEPPSPPTDIELKGVSSSQFELAWSHPTGEFSPSSSLSYIIDITSNGNSSVYTTDIGDTSIVVSNLLPDTYYYSVIRSNYALAGLVGRYSESIRILTTSASPALPIINMAMYLNETGSKVAVCWELPHPINGTVLGFQIAWFSTPSRDTNIDENCAMAQYANVTDPGKRYYKMTEDLGFIPSEGGYVCIRSANRIGVSDWVYTSISGIIQTTDRPTPEGVINNSSDIGILSGAVLFALLAMVLAIVLVILIVYCIITKDNKAATQNNANHHSEIPEMNNIKYDDEVKEDLDSNESSQNGRKRNPAARAESTRSTTSRTAIIKTTDSIDGEEKQTCCNFV